MPSQVDQRRISIRFTADQKAAIDKAARAVGLSTAAFIRGAASRAANQTIEGLAPISMSHEAFATFIQELGRPASPIPAMVDFMSKPAPWEKQDG